MEEVVPTAKPTDTTLITVEDALLLEFVIIQRTDGTVVQREILAALHTRFTPRLLVLAA